MFSHKLFLISCVVGLLLLVSPRLVHAATFDPNGTFVIKTSFYGYGAKNPSDGSEWPKVAVYANNGKNFDGSLDYSDCTTQPGADTAGYSCGSPNLFQNKLIGVIEVRGGQYQQSLTVKKSQLLGKAVGGDQALQFSKLSYVFVNDYWNPSANLDRDVGITKIEILDPQQNNKVVKSIVPNAVLLQQIKQTSSGSAINVYVDWGLVNLEGTKNQQQDGMNLAFDQKEKEYVPSEVDSLPSFWENKTAGWMWKLTKEGSLNVVLKDLVDSLPQAPTASCKINLEPVTCSGEQATVRFGFIQQPNFQPSTNFNLRFNAYPGKMDECTNAQGQPIDWHCSKLEGQGEDFYGNIPLGTFTKQFTITPGVPYSLRVSIDRNAAGTQLPATACTSQTVTFTCPKQVASTLPGDLNNDKVVTVADYTLLLQSFGWQGTPGGTVADINKDGKVDISDYSKVLENFGKSQ